MTCFNREMNNERYKLKRKYKNDNETTDLSIFFSSGNRLDYSLFYSQGHRLDYSLFYSLGHRLD